MKAAGSAAGSNKNPRQDNSVLILIGMLCLALLLGILARYVRSRPRMVSANTGWTEPSEYNEEEDVDGTGTFDTEPETYPEAQPVSDDDMDAPAEPEQAPIRPSTGNSFLNFINGCADWDFEAEDFAGFDKQQYIRAINAIFAHAGRRFSDRDRELREYYEQFDWYHPWIDGSDFHESLLNGHEVTNLYRLLDYGISAGFRGVTDADKQLTAFMELCGDAYFDLSDLSELDADMTFLAWNAIYARSGWAFESDYLRAFFSRFDWYQPLYGPEDFRENLLNDCQKFNRSIVHRFDAEHGFSHVYSETEQYEELH